MCAKNSRQEASKGGLSHSCFNVPIMLLLSCTHRFSPFPFLRLRQQSYVKKGRPSSSGDSMHPNSLVAKSSFPTHFLFSLCSPEITHPPISVPVLYHDSPTLKPNRHTMQLLDWLKNPCRFFIGPVSAASQTPAWNFRIPLPMFGSLKHQLVKRNGLHMVLAISGLIIVFLGTLYTILQFKGTETTAHASSFLHIAQATDVANECLTLYEQVVLLFLLSVERNTDTNSRCLEKSHCVHSHCLMDRLPPWFMSE